MRRLLPLLVSFLFAACATSGSGGPVLPGRINAPPPPLAAADDPFPLGVLWSWQETRMSDDTRHVPDAPERYTLEFQSGGRVVVRADCNRGSASYERTGSGIAIGPVALTRMACPPGSRDAEFLKGLGAASAMLFRGNDLVLTLKVDSGSMRFSASRP